MKKWNWISIGCYGIAVAIGVILLTNQKTGQEGMTKFLVIAAIAGGALAALHGNRPDRM